MAQKPPAFQFYPRNWLTSRTVAMMSRGEQADYLHLLCHAWLSDEPGTLPTPIETAAKIVGWKASKLRHFLTQFPTTFIRKTEHGLDLFWNEFLHPQWVKYQEISEKRRVAASKSSANASHVTGSSSSSSSSSSINTTTTPKTYGQQTSLAVHSPDPFEEFWKAYPKKVAKIAARRAWSRVAGANGHSGEIILGVEKWKASGMWNDIEFVPHAATFLNQRRWEDEVPKSSQEQTRENIRRAFEKRT